MNDIRINGNSLELPLGNKITLEMSSPLSDLEVVKGTKSLPLTISASSDVNRHELGYPDLLQSGADRRKSYDCELYSEGVFILNGKFKLAKPTNKMFPSYLLADAGGFGNEVKDLRLRELDLPTVTMPTIGMNTDLYFVNFPEAAYESFHATGTIGAGSIFRKYYRFSFTYVKDTLSVEVTQDYTQSIEETLRRLEGKIQIEDRIPAEATAKGNTLMMLPEDTGAQFYVARIYHVTWTINDQLVPVASSVMVWDDVLTTYFYQAPDLTLMNGSVNHTSANYYVLPTVYNPDFYSIENKSYCGYMNFYNNGYRYNDAFNPTKYTLVPMVFVKPVLIKAIESAGWSVEGDFLTDSDFDNLLFYTTRSLDKQQTDIKIPFNAYTNSFKISDQLPDMSVVEFLNELRNFFCLGYFFNNSEKKVTIRYLRDIVNAGCRKDLSAKVLPGHSEQQEDFKEFHLSFALDAMDATTKRDPVSGVLDPAYESYKTGIGSESEKIEVRISTLASRNMPFYVQSFPPQVITRTYPYTRQAGISNLFGQEANSYEPRFLFWKGVSSDALGSYPLAGNARGLKKLAWNGATGLFELFWKDFISFKQQTKEVEMQAYLDIVDFKNFRFDEKVHINGLNFLPQKLSITLPIKSPAKLTLYRA